MAVELKYLGGWLIPLRSGYQPSWPLAIDPQPRHGASGAHSQPRRGAASVVASYALRTPEMMAWWEGFWSTDLALGANRVIAMLDVAGYMAQSTAVISSARYTSYSRNMAVIELSLFIDSPAPVSTGYITSWPYPTSMDVDSVISESSPNDGGVLAMPPSAGVESAAVAALILSGGEIKSAQVPVTADAESAHAAALIVSGGYLKSARIQYDARGDSQDYAVAAAHVLDGGIIETIAIFHDLRIYDTDAAACSAQILSGGVIA